MFTVDPTYKKPSFINNIFGVAGDTYGFLQLTQNRPVWVLQVSISVDEEDYEENYGIRRYLFDELDSALEIASHESWSSKHLYVLWPDHMALIQHMSFSRITQIWECEEPCSNALCTEVTTEAGVHLLNEVETSLDQVQRKKIIWPA